MAIGGGLLLWQLLPIHQKKDVTALVDGGIVRPGSTVDEAPPPSYRFNQCEDQSNCCNGLASNCDMGVHEILYAGMHNAHSAVQDGFFIAFNHQYNFAAALDYGYRVINLDIAVCNNELSLVHGMCRLGRTDPAVAFQAIHDWLGANPTEVVLIVLQIDNEASGSSEPTVDLGRIFNTLNRIIGFTNRLYQKIPDEPWPTLREMIETDQRVLLFHYNGDVACTNPDIVCPPGFHDWFEHAAETKFIFNDMTDFDNKTEACGITRGRPMAPFYALNLFIRIPSKPLAISYLNTPAFLNEHIAACSAVNNNRDVNILFVDFWSEGEVPKVVQTYNKKLVPVERRILRYLRRFWG